MGVQITSAANVPWNNRDQPALAHPAPPQDFREVESRQLGWWWLEVFLIRTVMALQDSVPAGLAASSGIMIDWHWRGDRLSIYRRNAEMVLVWRVRIDPSGGFGTRRNLLDRVNESENGHWLAEADGWDVMIVVAESEIAALSPGESRAQSECAAFTCRFQVRFRGRCWRVVSPTMRPRGHRKSDTSPPRASPLMEKKPTPRGRLLEREMRFELTTSTLATLSGP